MSCTELWCELLWDTGLSHGHQGSSKRNSKRKRDAMLVLKCCHAAKGRLKTADQNNLACVPSPYKKEGRDSNPLITPKMGPGRSCVTGT